MDANGTRFHLLAGKADWSPPEVTISAGDDLAAEARWDEERGAVSLAPRVFLPPEPGRPSRNIESRRGAAADRYGNVYRISDDRRAILVRSSGSQETGTLFPAPPRPVHDSPPPGQLHDAAAPAPDLSGVHLSGLCVTCHHRLVAGFTRPGGRGGLCVFDLFAPAPPLWVEWPVERIQGGGGFDPFDLAPLPDGGVLVLDRANRRLWGMDAQLSALVRPGLGAAPAPMFKPASGSGPGGAEPSISTFSPLASWPLGSDPVAVEVLPEGRAAVLVNRAGQPFAGIHVVRPFETPLFEEALSTGVLAELLPPEARDGFTLAGHDMALTPSPGDVPGRLGRLFVAPATGLQAYAFDLDDRGPGAAPRHALSASPAYLPMYGFTDRSLIVFNDRPYHDAGDAWVLLTERPRRRYRRQARIETGPLDSGVPACVWHRIVLDGSLPRGTSVELSTRAADTEAELAASPWLPEPRPVRRRDGSEVPHTPKPATGPHLLPDETGTFDSLLQRARGRFFQLRVTLSGDGTTTPRLRALRVHYPRFSYLDRYLPAIYREEPSSASFLDRLLSLFEGFYTPIEDRIAAAQALFDVRSAPPEALDWLATWLGVALDPAWNEDRRRLFLRHAADFFRWRGTARGIITALELALGECVGDDLFDESTSPGRRGIRIVEKFLSRRLPGVIAGDPTELDGLRELSVTGLWRPPAGGESLSQHYRDALESAGVPEELRPASFPIRQPEDRTAELWRTFCKQVLGFMPLSRSADAPLFRAFLRRRYGSIEALRAAHGVEYTLFDDAPLPSALPPDGAPLVDWYTFEGQLAMARYAHRFVVVLPVRPGDAAGAGEYEERRRLAQRLVALEKPAHTAFDVQFYWAMFRAGEARLGTDTMIHKERAPELLGPFILDRSYLAQGHLAPRPPGDAADRHVLGRDALRPRARVRRKHER